MLQWDYMAKSRPIRRHHRSKEKPIAWLPVDSRLMYPLLAFRRVRGPAKLFLGLEMILATCVVVGTYILVILSLLE